MPIHMLESHKESLLNDISAGQRSVYCPDQPHLPPPLLLPSPRRILFGGQRNRRDDTMTAPSRVPHADRDHARTTDLDTDYTDNSKSNGNAETTSTSSLRAPSRHEHEHEHELDDAEDLSQLPSSSTAEDAPMPWRQLIVLILMRFAEPICFTQIFPYVNRMMLDIGAAKSPAEVRAALVTLSP